MRVIVSLLFGCVLLVAAGCGGTSEEPEPAQEDIQKSLEGAGQYEKPGRFGPPGAPEQQGPPGQ